MLRTSSFLLFLLLILTPAYSWEVSGNGSLIELYTSEGCSSCPPADAWMSGLRNRSGLWKDFVPAGFHVDYWDGLGWPDKFAQAEFTQRQRTYATLWNTSTVFTPAIVVQGENKRGEIEFPRVSHSLKASLMNNELTVSGASLKGATVHVAWLAMNVETDVKRGENAGKKLRHDFIVLKHQILGEYGVTKKWPLQKPTSTPAPVAALIVWLEVAQKPVVAAGGLFK